MCLRVLLLLIFVYTPNANSTYLDRELNTSLYCAKIFRYYENKYQLPKDILYAISLKETGKQHSEQNIKIVWPWSVNVEGQGYFFPKSYEAIQFVKNQIKKGKQSIDVGCMQINLKQHPNAFKSIEQAFDPKTNIEYGAYFLRSKYDQLQDWPTAIAHYHSATKELGGKYKKDVLIIAKNLPLYKKNMLQYISGKYFKHFPSPQKKIFTKNFDKYQRYRTNLMVYIPRHASSFNNNINYKNTINIK